MIESSKFLALQAVVHLKELHVIFFFVKTIPKVSYLQWNFKLAVEYTQMPAYIHIY